MNLVVGVIEWSIIIVPLIISIVSLILFSKQKINFGHLFIVLFNFLLAVWLPICMFAYFYHANFVDFKKKNDFDYLIKNMYNNSSEAWLLFIIMIIQIVITFINVIYCVKKYRKYLYGKQKNKSA